MESKNSRYQSRILREMHQNTENPFNSPPSSTGSHGTVTMTSNISLGPEGESTRRFDDESLRLPAQPSRQEGKPSQSMPYNINTSVLGRTFPEWKGLNSDAPEQEPTEDIYNVTSDNITYDLGTKENIPPTSSTLASPTDIKSAKATKATAQKSQGHSTSAGAYKGPYLHRRSRMQPTVEDEIEPSTIGRTAGLDRNEGGAKGQRTPRTASSPVAANRSKPRRGNVTTLLETLKSAQSHEAEKADAPAETPSQKPAPRSQRFPPPVANAATSRMDRRHNLSHMNMGTPNHTAHSFFLPNLTHMNDFISGTLRLSSMKNGMPVFVKHGKVHDRESKRSPDHHVEIEAVAVPEDEEKIFVSLDKIKEEIQALKEHDDLVSQQAETLQQEVAELQIQVAKYKSRKDSAIGSDSESSVIDHLNTQKSRLEDQVASLQSRLDQANRKISINEIHSESYKTERDEALEKIKRLESELNGAREQLEAFQDENTRDFRNAELENGSLRTDNNALRAQHKSLLEENQSLRAHNEAMSQQQSRLQQELKDVREQLRSTEKELETVNDEYKTVLEENALLQQDNKSLERHNDKYFNDNKALQQKNSLLERRVHDLQDDNARLNELFDAANAATGTMTVDAKDMKSRLEAQNHKLSAENEKLQQEIIDLTADFASKGRIHEQEKRQLNAANVRLQKQFEQIGVKFDRIMHESKVQASKFEEKQSTMTQQIQELMERESALTGQLKESTNHESTLQHQLQRKAQAAFEARQISKDLLKAANDTNKGKKVKTARIVEPVNAKETSRSVTSQTDMPIQDDYTRQIDLTQGSDGSNFAKSEISELREALLQARVGTQPQDVTEETMGSDGDAGITEDASQSLPPPFVPRARAESAKTRISGILKNGDSSKPKANKTAKIARYEDEQDHSGRFSIKSGFSDMSLPTQGSHAEFTRPRHNSDSARFELDTPEERNMTSALFMDDITLEGQKQAERQQAKKAVPSLSKDAKRVLDNLCHDHDCRNCIVCARVIAHKHEDNAATSKSKKRTIRVERPISVNERAPTSAAAAAQYEDQPTLRPARDPAVALAVVIKGLRDEEAHLEAALAKAQAQYNALEPSTGRRQRQWASAEIRRLMRQRDVKRDQIYDLHDVLEGQRAGGQEMTAHDVEVTIASVLSRDENTWNGIVD